MTAPHILADYLRVCQTLTRVMLDEQDPETLLHIQAAVADGAALRLETTYGEAMTVPRVVLVLIAPNGERRAVTEFVTNPGDQQ